MVKVNKRNNITKNNVKNKQLFSKENQKNLELIENIDNGKKIIRNLKKPGKNCERSESNILNYGNLNANVM